jgi:hypothetical protein
MSDGIPGRDHTYAYLHGYDGKWYKSFDAIVTEVRPLSWLWWRVAETQSFHQVPEETVLNDSTGLHMGAGPYMIIYSRAIDSEPEMENMEEVAAQYDRGVKVSEHSPSCSLTPDSRFLFLFLG